MQENINIEQKTAKREGQIIKRGNSFLVRVYLHEDGNGKKIYYNKTIKGNYREAEEHLVEYLQKKHSGKMKLPPSNKKLCDFAEDFLKNISNNRKRNKDLDIYKLKQYINPYIGFFKMKDFTPLIIENFYKELRQKISKKTGKPLSGTTRKHVHVILSSIFSYALRTRQIIENPMNGVISPKVDTKEKNAFSPDEAKKFLEAIENYQSNYSNSLFNRIGAMFHLALETGLRPEEYFALKWSDLHLEGSSSNLSSILQVRRVAIRTANKNEWWFDEPKTLKSRRSIPLSNQLVSRLKKHKIQLDDWKLKTKEWNENNLVFPNNKGTPLYPDSVRKMFKKILKKAELNDKHFHLYDLRHSCASLLLRANVHPKIVSERLGHSSIAITLDTYSHSVPTMQEDATLNMEGMLYRSKSYEKIPPSIIDLTESLINS